MNDNIAIKTSNLTKVFNGNIAVDNLNLEIERGELFGLVGPDGAGKTTIMRLLTAIMEPTSGVDPISRRNFWNLIYEMSQAGTTIFVTTHYMDEADYCDRLALIYRGRIIAEGTPNELKQEYCDVSFISPGHRAFHINDIKDTTTLNPLRYFLVIIISIDW